MEGVENYNVVGPCYHSAIPLDNTLAHAHAYSFSACAERNSFSCAKNASFGRGTKLANKKIPTKGREVGAERRRRKREEGER